MTATQAQTILELRRRGRTYADIAAYTGGSPNTVKSYCLRNDQTLQALIAKEICKHCGSALIQQPKRKQRSFCSDRCRHAWWGAHRDLMRRGAMRRFRCLHCGRDFEACGNDHRKYCSRQCYHSKEKDAMLHSLSVQVSYYSALIQRNLEWNYCGVYSDEDYTGTKDSRPEFQRLLEDCRAGKIDIVLTKSISRFARNTVTLLATLREMTGLGVSVYFEKENLWSNGGDGELLISILASYAQEESRSVSENCRWRIRKQFSEGKSTPCRPYGYSQEDDTFSIIPEEAVVVHQIFADYLSGMGILAIQKKLFTQGMKFGRTRLAKTLRNEKYAGDLLLQKTFTQDHLSKKKVKNIGQLPQYLVRDSHPAIIDRTTFDAVQTEIARRHLRWDSPASPPSAQGCAHYPFTGMIRCGICGAPYRHKIAGAAQKYKKPVWICATFNSLGKAVCPSQQIPDDILQAKVVEAGGIEELVEILVPGPFMFTFIYRDGRRVDLTWTHPSRRESWTPEMRETARQRNLKGAKL